MRKLTYPLLALGLAAGCGSAFTAGGTAAGGSPSVGGAGSGSSGGASDTDTAGATGATDSGSGGNDGVAGSTSQAGSVGMGGAVGSGGHAGTGGSGGSAGSGATCPELFSRAKVQLDAASVCDTTLKAQQCTGAVATTCGCQVPVEKNDSAETKAYLSTLAQISQKNCRQNCPLIACVPVTNPQCSVPSGSTGTIGTCASGLP